MKDKLTCPHNGGELLYLLQSVAIHFNLTVCALPSNLKHRFMALKWVAKLNGYHSPIVVQK